MRSAAPRLFALGEPVDGSWQIGLSGPENLAEDGQSMPQPACRADVESLKKGARHD